MKIYLGADHGGFELKEKFKEYIHHNHQILEIEDCGAFISDPQDDYPPVAFCVAEKVSVSPIHDSLGILLCRSGSGVVIAANKVKNIRAVELYNEQIAAHAKSHNHANVIAFSGDYLSFTEMIIFFEIFIKTLPDLDERHKRRIQQITNYENQK